MAVKLRGMFSCVYLRLSSKTFDPRTLYFEMSCSRPQEYWESNSHARESAFLFAEECTLTLIPSYFRQWPNHQYPLRPPPTTRTTMKTIIHPLQTHPRNEKPIHQIHPNDSATHANFLDHEHPSEKPRRRMATHRRHLLLRQPARAKSSLPSSVISC